jgi:hypothetical protein
MRKTTEYVNNKRFFDEIVAYQKRVEEAKEKGLDLPRIPDYIGQCLLKIAERLSTKPNFINYSFRDDMIADAVENGILYFHDFDPEKSQNPFAYFTQITYYAFIRRINKEEKNRYTIYKNFQETITNTSDSNYLLDGDDNHLISTTMYDNINVFMEKFEKKEEEKRVKRKTIKEGLQKFIEE